MPLAIICTVGIPGAGKSATCQTLVHGHLDSPVIFDSTQSTAAGLIWFSVNCDIIL